MIHGRMSRSHQKRLEDPFALLSQVASKLRSLCLAWAYPFLSIGKGVWAHYSCDLSRSIAHYIMIGDNVSLERDVWLNIPNVPRWREPVIILDDGVKFGRRTIVLA